MRLAAKVFLPGIDLGRFMPTALWWWAWVKLAKLSRSPAGCIANEIGSLKLCGRTTQEAGAKKNFHKILTRSKPM